MDDSFVDDISKNYHDDDIDLSKNQNLTEIEKN